MQNLSQTQRSMLRLMAEGMSDEEIAANLGLEIRALRRLQRQVTARFIDRSIEELSDDALYERSRIARLSQGSQAFEARFSALMSIAPEAVFLVDGLSGEILMANDVACHTFGYTKKELIGLSVEALIAPEMAELHVHYRHGFLRSIRKRQLGFHPRIIAQRKDGRAVDLDIALIATAGSQEVLAICTPKVSDGSPADATRSRVSP